MKLTISGNTYDSETAHFILEVSNSYPSNSYHYISESLFRTEEGQFFICGHYCPLLDCSDNFGNSTTGGYGLHLLSDADALLFLQIYSCLDVIETYFPVNIIEG